MCASALCARSQSVLDPCAGFEFHASEPTALQQRAGGPCGVLAPIQAHILRILLNPPASNWRRPDPDSIRAALLRALAESLQLMAVSGPVMLVC